MYIYLTTNLVNGIGYLGRRKCECPIEEDEYIGSGKLLKLAIEKYGEDNFKKTILSICNSQDEMYQKEMEYIEKYNAVYSYDYYNIDFGGAPKLDVKLNEFQIRKYNYMKKQIESDKLVFYFFKFDENGNLEKKISPSVKIGELIIKNGERPWVDGKILYNNDVKKSGGQTSRFWCPFKVTFDNYDDAVNWLIEKEGYFKIDIETYNDLKLRYDKTMATIDNTFSLAKQIRDGLETKVVQNNRSLKNEVKEAKKYIPVNLIKERAKSNNSFRLLNDLITSYENNFSPTEIFYALTGHASIQENYLNTEFSCTKREYEKAREALNYLLEFKDVVNRVKGRKSFLNMAILFCYNLNIVDNNALKTRLHKEYKKLDPISSVKTFADAIDQVDKYYNHLRNKTEKVDIRNAFRTRNN